MNIDTKISEIYPNNKCLYKYQIPIKFETDKGSNSLLHCSTMLIYCKTTIQTTTHTQVHS